MYQGGNYDQPLTTGKRVYGLPSRKEPSFSLGWDQANNMNSYQVRKGKAKEVTGKVTGIQLEPKKPEYAYDEALEKQRMQQLYEKLAYENPDIPEEELMRYMDNYEQQQKKNRPRPMPPSQQSQIQRRAPIKQKQSMRDIIYNGVGVDTMEEKRAASRRNNSNLVLGDGYNYFQEKIRR